MRVGADPKVPWRWSVVNGTLRVMMELPTGTVTFLFTDLELSTRLWDQEPDAMGGALARHDATHGLRGAFRWFWDG